MAQTNGRKTVRALHIATAAGIALLGVGLLADAGAVSDGVRRGLEICGGTLIPSLFPFMTLSVFLSLTDYARLLSVPLAPVTTRVFKLPKELGVVVLLSMIGGYPVGAKMISGLLEQNRISKETAQRMLCFCVNSGPSFLISAVGIGMFHSKRAGVILFCTQTFATLLIGWIVSLRAEPARGSAKPAVDLPVSAALVMAVQGATSSMLAMCAFAVLFSGLLSLLSATGLVAAVATVLPVGEAVVQAVASGLLEVTSGCIAAAQVGGVPAFALASVMVSFSGLSVLFQIFSCFGGAPVSFRPLVLSRLVHALVSTAVAIPLFRMLCDSSMDVWLGAQPQAVQVDGKTTLLSVCLLGMCTIFSLSLGDACRGKK